MLFRSSFSFSLACYLYYLGVVQQHLKLLIIKKVKWTSLVLFTKKQYLMSHKYDKDTKRNDRENQSTGEILFWYRFTI